MSLRHGLLALLADGPMHGYSLKTEFERRTGHLRTVNVGQIYTTLDRLERDGMVTGGAHDTDGRRPYALTAAGRMLLDEWLVEPVAGDAPLPHELLVKVLIALETPGVDGLEVVQAQRTALLAILQAHRRRRVRAEEDDDLAGQLAFDAVVTRLEGDLRWLDVCEERLRVRKPVGGRSRR